jgi:hypothetical protein
VEYDFPDFTELPKVFAEVERQTGIPLFYPEKLKADRMRTKARESKKLREFMWERCQSTGGMYYWQQRGNGYSLEVDAAKPERMASRPPRNEPMEDGMAKRWSARK